MEKYILFFILITLLQIGNLLGAPEIQLPNGLIRGREGTTIQDKQYYAFEKIPYATPPLGELRFKPPIPPSNWDAPLDTLDLDVSCYQRDNNGQPESEDCLYLAVFTPELPTENSTVSLPVMLYIHGGGFVSGSGMHVYSDRIINQDVILVVINYRLGPFGFLATEDDVIPGNMGLKDQHLAIKWTHDNIHLFGGDPNKITIFGQSAGSASCSYQLLNQESTGLINGAILESGTFLNPGAFQRNPKTIAFGTAAVLNSTFETNQDSTDLLQYLQSVGAQQLKDAAQEYYNSVITLQNMEIMQGIFFAPVVEVKNPDAFLTRKMYGLLQAGNVVPVPILIGTNSEEALAFSQDQASVQWNMNTWDQNLGWLVPDDMQVTDPTSKTNIGSQIRNIYTGGEPLGNHLGDGIRYCSDNTFTRSVIRTAEIYSQFAKTYYYQFSYDGQLSHSNVQYEGAEHVGHSQELAYIFCAGSGCDISGFPEADQVTSERVITIWTNFAKYQNPTPEQSEVLQNIVWPAVSTANGDIMYVDIGENLEVKNHPKENTYSKWIEIYNNLDYNDFDTF